MHSVIIGVLLLFAISHVAVSRAPDTGPRRTLRRGPNHRALSLYGPRSRLEAMRDTDILADVARLLGEPARTRILTALLGGCWFPGEEPASFCRVADAAG